MTPVEKQVKDLLEAQKEIVGEEKSRNKREEKAEEKKDGQ
jgi:hypothetical protein